ncbi:hypothetical protein RvY_03864-2 [Ramazzottius varieornatus]|uniref:C2H2-type domain-containing protein n=1 Tax=Ramazzottius varieornatus TaxID=947166 RepID=A0A1D1UT52_RAMVA|nr:hypothetical protein RvY_03864-2 [Ramazzottius varieornatus]
MADADSEEQDQSQISDDGQDAEMGTVGEESAEGNAESGDVEEEVYQTVGVTIKNKPYLCTYENCDKAFQWKSYLERHIQSHTGIKPNVSEKKRGPRKRKNADGTEDDTPKLYVCNDCGKEFNWKSYLDRHSQIHTGMKPFACDFAGCDYKTGQSGNLKMHKQTHTGEKPHACDWPDCEYRSTHPGNLKNHMLTHTGEKRFKCSIVGCEYQAIQYETLNQHMRTHTGEKPFKCPWEGCDYAGRQSATLKEINLMPVPGKVVTTARRIRAMSRSTTWGIPGRSRMHVAGRNAPIEPPPVAPSKSIRNHTRVLSRTSVWSRAATLLRSSRVV